MTTGIPKENLQEKISENNLFKIIKDLDILKGELKKQSFEYMKLKEACKKEFIRLHSMIRRMKTLSTNSDVSTQKLRTRKV
jgi:hypothetical protein